MARAKVGTRNEATREAWLERALREVPAGARILDAGAGERQYERFCPHLSYVAQDFAQYDGQGNGAGLQTGRWDQTRLDLVCDITAIPEPDASFDAVMCVEVFEHLPEPARALDEFTRLLRPGGQLILTAPFASLTHFAPYHFASGYGRYFYEHHLPRRGFDIVDLSPNGNYWEYLAQELRRIPSLARSRLGFKPNPVDRGALSLVVRMLGRISPRDEASSELLAYGWHVRAVKRR
jgi:ubiquinone/menaquinone biosynthesis C-methylase UbiE